MPLGFPFRRKTPARSLSETKRAELQAELNEAIERLTQFSTQLRKELDVSDAEEERLNPRNKGE